MAKRTNGNSGLVGEMTPLTEEEAALEQRLMKLEVINGERELAFMEEERVLREWEAPARLFKKRNKEFYTTIGAIVILLSIILFFAREFVVVAVILSVAFLAYVLASVEPETVSHMITSRGIRSGGRFYGWGDMVSFWFHEKYGQKMMSVKTFLAFPQQLVFLLGGENQEEIREIMSRFVIYNKPEPGFVDKAGEWLAKKVPLEE